MVYLPPKPELKTHTILPPNNQAHLIVTCQECLFACLSLYLQHLSWEISEGTESSFDRLKKDLGQWMRIIKYRALLCSLKIKVGAGLWPFLQIRYTKVIHQELPNVKKIKQELKQSHNTICNMYSFSIERIHISFNFFLLVRFTLVSVLVCSFIHLFIQQIFSECLGTTPEAENTSINGTCLMVENINKQTYNDDIMAKKS